MMTVNEIMQQALKLGACNKSNGVSDWKSISWLFFSPQGIEFCEKNNFPNLSTLNDIRDNIREYGIFVNEGDIISHDDTKIALIGDTFGHLSFNNPDKVHKVVLMHGAKAFIKVNGYAVVRLINIGGCDVVIEKSKESIILE